MCKTTKGPDIGRDARRPGRVRPGIDGKTPGRKTSTNQSIRWAVWFAITGDVRFLSHRDVMRLMARAGARAQLPIKMTQGFNPHPKLSLALPRPVAVASRCELLVIELSSAGQAHWSEDLSAQLPDGMKLIRCEPLRTGPPPQVRAASYELELHPDELEPVRARSAKLARQKKWELSRPTRDRRRPGAKKLIDIKPAVTDLAVRGQKLCFTIAHTPSGAARCEEVLALLGFENGHNAFGRSRSEILAQVVRIDLQCDLHTESQQIRTADL